MNELKYITSTTDKSFNNSVYKITTDLLINMSDEIAVDSTTRPNRNLKKHEVELLTQMYEDQDNNPNSKFVLSYIKID